VANAKENAMRKLIVFNQVSLDGYFTDKNNDMSWAHRQDPEWNAFVAENATSGGELVFGRVTYDQMASYWPTPQAFKNSPAVAEAMNELPKVVFSRSLDHASWKNSRLVKRDITEEMRRMKKEPGLDMVIFGSGSIVAQMTDAGLVDEYQVVVNPIVLGSGRTMFDGVRDRMNLVLQKSRAFQNGNVVLYYAPQRGH
jgi:dihydrofolate reductase